MHAHTLAHVRLFDQVEIRFSGPETQFPTTLESDGTIHFQVLDHDRQVQREGTCSFHVFWDSHRQSRELFDPEVLEQLIIKRMQDYQNEVSLVPVVITRVVLSEVRNMQAATAAKAAAQTE